MKIAVIGYSGCGKSTLAKFLSEKYNAPILYIDTVHWLPGWKERDPIEKSEIVKDFLDSNSSWVIDGTYGKLHFERRMEEADKIIFMNFNRVSCFLRALERYVKNKDKARESMTEGCDEKFDFEFISWLLFKGRTKKRKMIFKEVVHKYPQKTVIIKNQPQLTKYKKQIVSVDKNII